MNGEVFRVGSNEFLVSVPETGKDALVELAEKLNSLLGRKQVRDEAK